MHTNKCNLSRRFCARESEPATHHPLSVVGIDEAVRAQRSPVGTETHVANQPRCLDDARFTSCWAGFNSTSEHIRRKLRLRSLDDVELAMKSLAT